MTLPTVNDVQAVDEVLTGILVGYQQADSRFVASRVFPAVTVNRDSGTYYIYTKKYWFADGLEQRAPGGTFATLPLGVETTTYSTVQFAGQENLADEVRANSQVPGDLEANATRHLAQSSLIRKEVAFAADFMVTSVWGTSGTWATDADAKISTYASSDPWKGFDTAMRTISANTGMLPNSAVMGHIVHSRLLNHPDIIDRMKYVAIATKGNIESVLASVFGLDNWFVSYASYTTTNVGQSSITYSNIIDDDLLVCYTAPSPGIFTASAGYTFAWSGGGGMGSMYSGRNEEQHYDYVQIKEQWDQKAVATDLGYFWADCTD